VAGAASLVAALSELPSPAERERVGGLRERLENGLRGRLPDVEILGAASERLCNTSCAAFTDCEGDGIMMALDLSGIAVSTGSACSSGSIEPSPILIGMGLTALEARSTVRYSLTRAATAADVDRVVDATVDVVERMRRA
jgi:cysteine desulfurase